MRIMKQLLLILLLMTLMALSRAENASRSVTFPLPPYCPTTCGNTSIQYPFGIGEGCFRPGFNLTCDQSLSPAKLFLGDTTTEITGIYTNDSTVVMQSSPVSTMSVEVESFFTSWTPSVIGPATFLWQGSNNLWVSGCSVSAFIIDLVNNITVGACSSICPGKGTSPEDEGSAGYDECDGIRCCCIPVPGNLTSFGVQLTRLNQSDPHLADASTVKIFLSDLNYFTEEDLAEFNERTSLRATLQWFITDQPSCDAALKSSSTYACLGNKVICNDSSVSSIQIPGYFCECYHWASQGNPYIPNGCLDLSSTTVQPTSCTTKCGDLDVPFPFGIEPACYRGKSFALTCNRTVNPPILLLSNGDAFDQYVVQVVNISVEEGQLEINAVDPWICIDLLDTSRPFGFFGGQGFTIDWVIDFEPCTEAMKNRTSYACVSDHSICLDANITVIDSSSQYTIMDTILGYRCKCSQGYGANPYLHNGCQDIDECKFPEMYACDGICINTMGSYICTCPPGTDGDPKLGPCIANRTERQAFLLGIIIGASIGSGMLFMTVSFLFFSRIWKRKKQKRIREKYFYQNHGLLMEKLISSNKDIAEATKIFSLHELEKATNNFDDTRILGRGGHGTVYKGILSNQCVVSIKKPKIAIRREIDQFLNEVVILSQINHRNIVKLYGCCLETEVPLLVYEFISNGTLSDHLHTENRELSLSWDDRLRIATEVAGALAYLHSGASISIFHRDVKSSNILLDDHYTVKVSDFGASRNIPLDQTHIVTAVQGTFGYLDPEYYQTNQLTEKSDVYSFGVILVELLTGQRPTSSIGNEEERLLLMYFLQAIKDENIIELLEGRVMEEGTREEIKEVIQLAEMCLKIKGDERPTMKEVEFRLQSLRKKDKQKLEQCGVCTSKRFTSQVSQKMSNSSVMEMTSSIDYPR